MSVNSPPPDDLPVSYYLIKKCKLWVWDFDDTLINTDTYVKKKMDVISIRNRKDYELDEEFPQWRYFKRLIEFLLMHGKYVGIASFGTYEIIKAYMDRVLGFNQKYFGKQNIIAPCLADRDNRRFSIPPNKNEYIYQLMQAYRIQSFESVVLFDDMPSNVSSAIAIGVVGVQIATPRNGDINTSKMYFGPWIMTDLDYMVSNSPKAHLTYNNTKTRDNQCGVSQLNKHNQIYSKYQSVSNLENSRKNQSSSYSGSPRRKDTYSDTYSDTYPSSNEFNINHSKADFSETEHFEGNTFEYVKSAYGTGIGDRKITKKPEYRWNKMNVKNPPIWQNGNWQTDGGNMTFESYPEYSLGNKPFEIWEDNNKNGIYNNISRKNSKVGRNTSMNKTIKNNTSSLSSNFYEEGFENNSNSSSNSNNKKNKKANYSEKHIDKFSDGDNCESCKKITWNWITLTLMLIILMMVALCFTIK